MNNINRQRNQRYKSLNFSKQAYWMEICTALDKRMDITVHYNEL